MGDEGQGENQEKPDGTVEKKPEKKQESDTVENIVALSVFAVLILITVGLFTHGFGLFSQDASGGLGSNIQVPFESDPVRGDLTAPVRIFIFSDFECPFCKKGEATVQDVFEKYNGSVALIFKNFPLAEVHPYAMRAAVAAECAKEQEKFWEYHDYLFAHQDYLSDADLNAYAGELGLNTTEFSECLSTDRYVGNVNIDINDGKKIGISGTPTFIINGHALVGAQPESEFDKIIQAELSK